jgi:putative tryptophan/tyrosine transport system substrate-binding protein
MQGEVERALVVMGSTSPSGYLCNPGNAGTGYNWTAAIDAAAKHGAELTRVEVSKPDELHTAFNALKDRDALLVQWDFLLYPLRNRLAEVAAGDIRDNYGRAAVYVDRILKGARPADLPVDQASRFELVSKLNATKGLGITVPPALLARADEVIQ